MAAELESDLAEAEADDVSAVEILGESDPRRFAATWARERGLVSERAGERHRKGLWVGLAVAVVGLGLGFAALVLVRGGSGGGGTVALRPGSGSSSLVVRVGNS